jgi:hypothetical protein
MAGQDAPPHFSSDSDPDGDDFDGAVPDREVVAEAWDIGRAETAFTDQFVAGAPDLDITGDGRSHRARCWCTWWRSTPGTTADLLRERIDGRVGQ